jgi:hypothetical protein
MSEILRPLIIFIVITISLIAFFLVLKALFPQRLAKTSAITDAMPGRSFLVGLVNFLFFGALAMVFLALNDRVGKGLLVIPALFFLTPLTIGLSFGLGGITQLLGQRLAPQKTELQRTIWGTLALGFGCLLPIVGWFGLLPYTALLGLGAFIISFFYRLPFTLVSETPS